METQETLNFIVIDDDSINNHICRKSIEMAFPDADIQTFTDPEVALDHIRSEYTGQGTKKTILYLDINMPVLSGWDVLYKFMKFPEFVQNEFTIYILSSSVAVDDKQKAEKCRLVAGFVEKPLTVDILKTIC